jgi:hypothetical protein
MLKKQSIILALSLCQLTWAQDHPLIGPDSLKWMGNTSNSYETLRSDGLKTYFLKTDAPLRDNLPSSSEVKIEENSSLPYTRTGSTLFDSLFALTMQEVQKSGVSIISDPAFDDARCECFETGEKWRYVWTRDTAFAVDLGLAALDPKRSMSSLLFKVSAPRNGSASHEQIVQDTGSGGSWPISTDRVIWAQGAFETLKYLDQRSANYRDLLSRSYRALKNTVEADRFAVFDKADGLYRGEQSFLDWREQTYPTWAGSKVVHVGMSKGLSTNVVHYMALLRLSELAAEMGDRGAESTYRKWAQDLKEAVNRAFWDGSAYRSLKVTYLEPRTFKYYDLLGTSLAIISGIASKEQGASALNTYPQTQVGAPVIWPQRQDIPIYHNRAIWPFVTAYALKAAKKIQDPYLITAFIRSLMIGPAQNLSHMENFEFITLRNYYADGQLSGPVVNSRRQLWSVAGYASMVMDVLFGKEAKLGGLRFNPMVPVSMRETLFGSAKSVELNNLPYHGKRIKIVMNLPGLNEKRGMDQDGLFNIASIKLNGRSISKEDWISSTGLAERNEIVIDLSPPKLFPLARLVKMDAPFNPFQITNKERKYYYAPKTPNLAPVGLSGNWPLLSFHSSEDDAVTYHVYKDGKLLSKVKATYYLDQGHALDRTACYSITAVYDLTGNESFPSEPFCYWPTSSIQHYPANGPSIQDFGGVQVANSAGRIFFHEWGGPDQKLRLEKVIPTRSGTYAFQVEYANQDRVNTGITCGMKKITITNERTGSVVESSVLMFPHHEGGWSDSNFVPVSLNQNESYSVLIEDLFNMSYFGHFSSYKHRGGRTGAYNMFNVAEIKLLYLY